VLGGVFISYRRDDSSGFARGIYDRLARRLGRKSVFFDVDNIELGEDFVDVLSERVGRCDALVAVIGASWCSSADARNQRRLDHPHDFVRIEIEAALERGIRVIPVLVDGASMPRPEDLPDSLKKLARRQGIEVSHTHFDSDVKKLTRTLSTILEELRQREAAEALRLAEAEAARQADEERRQRDAAEAERIARETHEQQQAAEVARAEETQRLAAAEGARRAEEERKSKETEDAERAAGSELRQPRPLAQKKRGKRLRLRRRVKQRKIAARTKRRKPNASRAPKRRGDRPMARRCG
jgi:hypothetical protein